jgi:hypothetical protein
VLYILTQKVPEITVQTSAPASHSRNDEARGSEARAYVACKNFVKERLISPSSAHFPLTDFQAQRANNPSHWVVRSYVNHENGYGVKLRTAWICKVGFTDYGPQDLGVQLF